MDFEIFQNQDFITYVLPFIIFFSRILDVTIGTIRIIMISKGMKLFAPILGFFEVFIWIIVIGNLMKHTSGIVPYIFYSLGFATGNYIGMIIEEKVALGFVVLRVITQKKSDELIKNLYEEGIGTTFIDAKGGNGSDVNIVFSIVKRTTLDKALSIVKTFNPNAFYTIEDIRSVNRGVFPDSGMGKLSVFSKRRRKGK